jgi:F-type H+-transporting ATPase subunit delta
VSSSAVASRYARALADLAGAKDPKHLEATSSEIDLAARVLGSDAALLSFFANVAVSRAQKDEILATLAEKAKLSDLTRRFLGVLVDNGRMDALPYIARALAGIKDDALGIVAAEATVAVKLDDAGAAGLHQALETLTGRTVRLSVKVDPEVLGGARTQVGSRVYDGTLKTQLQALRRRLLATT